MAGFEDMVGCDFGNENTDELSDSRRTHQWDPMFRLSRTATRWRRRRFGSLMHWVWAYETGKTLSERRWHASFSKEGYLDIARVLRRIQRGGVHPSIRGAVWEFLLGCYDPNSTFDDRCLIRQRRRERYDDWKAECQKMVPTIGSGNFLTTPIVTDDGQPIENGERANDNEFPHQQGRSNDPALEKKVIRWKQVLPQIGLDVVRTDQSLVFYQTESNQAKLWNVLAIYAWLDSDVSYVQGMNDICSPIVMLLENEADAYWCFERAMRRLLMWAMEYNPNTFLLYETSAADATSANLTEKMLKRYGKFERNNVRTGCKDYQSTLAVFLAASILENKHKRILKEAQGLDDIVEILGDVTGNLDARKACKEALEIHKKFLKKASSIFLANSVKKMANKAHYFTLKINMFTLFVGLTAGSATVMRTKFVSLLCPGTLIENSAHCDPFLLVIHPHF
ncbi:hypothetical protein KSS87_023929 [Heliosperma pusillum]|nr:hypothetical protein KSS87_023929 [Heliosperma pusillum]